MQLTLTPMSDADVTVVEPWFDDVETEHWLGGREWPASLRRLMSEELPGVLERTGYVVRDAGRLVALVDMELYEDHSVSLALVVDPNQRGRGYGRAALRAVVDLLTARGVSRIAGWVVPANESSIRCVTAAGFACGGGLDADGFLEYVYRPVAPQRISTPESR
jgi:RimJ/RimL family protein N-acetyltransferase